MRNTIFISHATPEDNDFSIWLSSRLQLMGYDVWVDKNALLGGEKFWEEIDQIIRYKATMVLLVYSKNICIDGSPGRLRDGIYKEYSLAESISKQEELDNFIILLNIDGSEYNLFIGSDRLNQIPFYDNWAEGLNQLIKKFEKDKVPLHIDASKYNMGSWYENQYIVKNGIIPKRELYYNNRWQVSRLPDHFYIYQFKNEDHAKEININSHTYPVYRTRNLLTTFDPKLLTAFEEDIFEPNSVHKLKVDDVLSGIGQENFPTHKDAENHLKRLLRTIFHNIMRKRGMYWYEMANRRYAYYYTPTNLPSSNVSFEYSLGKGKRKKRKKLYGKYLDSKWHFAVSCKPILSPIIGYNLKSHLIFTDDGFTPWEDKSKMHSHRRSKGKAFFNEAWRDLLFAFLHGLRNHGKNVEMPLNDDFILSMGEWTELFMSDFGYYEPNKKDRQNVINYMGPELDEDEGDEMPEVIN